MRGLIAAYIGDIVQRSQAPVTPPEVDAVNTRRPCEEPLELSLEGSVAP